MLSLKKKTFPEHYNQWKNTQIQTSEELLEFGVEEPSNMMDSTVRQNYTQQKAKHYYCYYYLKLQAMYVCPNNNRLRRQNACYVTRRTALVSNC